MNQKNEWMNIRMDERKNYIPLGIMYESQLSSAYLALYLNYFIDSTFKQSTTEERWQNLAVLD